MGKRLGGDGVVGDRSVEFRFPVSLGLVVVTMVQSGFNVAV